jgi:hypothetical protein
MISVPINQLFFWIFIPCALSMVTGIAIGFLGAMHVK